MPATLQARTPDGDSGHMKWKEVWGGNQRVDRSFKMPGCDIWVYSRPCGEAQQGGDVYHLSSCASSRITRLLLADVSGHGDLAAELAGVLRELMRRNVGCMGQTCLAKVMNRQFLAISRHGGFATAIVSTFSASTSQLSLCNAGHPAPLLYRADSGAWTVLDQQPADTGVITNVPLGVVDQANYEQLDVRLDHGDMVLCYTDALIESRSADGDGKLLGVTGLLDTARTVDTSQTETVIPQLLEVIGSGHVSNLTEDDATMVLFHRNVAGARSESKAIDGRRPTRRWRKHFSVHRGEAA